MKYNDQHYEKVAAIYKDCGRNVSETQNHFPSVSERTIYRWIKVCRDRGLL